MIYKNLFLVSLVVALSTPSIAASLPVVKFQYSRLLDGVCIQQNGTPVEQAWMDELVQRLYEFQEAWDKEGAPLLESIVKSTGKEFKEKDFKAALVLCRRMPSMSFPLVINMGGYLKTMRPDPVEIKYFVGIALHELIHTFVVENINRPSALLEKYKKETPRVLAHLHVHALISFAFQSTGQPDRVKETSDFERRLGQDYIRSWDIVESEGYQQFVDEVK